MSPRPPHRFYFAGHIAPEAAYSTVELPANESHHLLRVLRLRPGTQIDIFDTGGSAWSAELLASTGEIASVRLLTPLHAEPQSDRSISIAVCMLKRSPMDWLIEKLSELGVDTLQPLVSARTIVPGGIKADGENPERWDRLVLAAAKQCGRNRPLEILPTAKIADWLARTRPPAHTAFAAVAPGAQTIGEWLHERTDVPLPIWVVIGPEGGWTAEEHDAFALAAFRPVSMGNLILRAETAAMAAAAACRLV